ncbi:unnamed protein product [Polarella glacialis]|uniref:Uncharacterized protein n=1 Tax=Polarella glacialis TaxID=89957 RepID=A0A813ECH0_POLGL|nr:unnamed protein product [Polarella glacialis]
MSCWVDLTRADTHLPPNCAFACVCVKEWQVPPQITKPLDGQPTCFLPRFFFFGCGAKSCLTTVVCITVCNCEGLFSAKVIAEKPDLQTACLVQEPSETTSTSQGGRDHRQQ